MEEEEYIETDLEKIKKALEKLEEKEPFLICQYLHKRKIKGKLKDECDCPIARYLKKDTGIKDLKVNRHLIAFDKIEIPLKYGNVSKFILYFDEEAYCDLIEK